MSSELESLAEHAEEALVSFLRAELELGFTYWKTAKVESSLDSEGEKRAMKLAKGALNTIERFRPSITDPAIQEELRESAMDLERLLSSKLF